MTTLNSLRQLKKILEEVWRKILLLILKILPRSHKSSFWLSATNKIWKGTGLQIDSPVFIDSGFKCVYPKNIKLGQYVSLGHDNHIWAFQKVTIGAYTQTAKDLLIISGGHCVDSLEPASEQQVRIGSGCWIGARVTILGGVSIGKGVIIGASSLVNKNLPDFSIAVGNPARISRFREPSEIQWNPFKKFRLIDLP